VLTKYLMMAYLIDHSSEYEIGLIELLERLTEN
jgi:hypothetical protein